ncbi:MAG: hypothetical protein MRQ13_00545 [Candidatus Midichloria sp.]|nr:hypothetical protein [Candidatus Midichloria sp.]
MKKVAIETSLEEAMVQKEAELNISSACVGAASRLVRQLAPTAIEPNLKTPAELEAEFEADIAIVYSLNLGT